MRATTGFSTARTASRSLIGAPLHERRLDRGPALLLEGQRVVVRIGLPHREARWGWGRRPGLDEIRGTAHTLA